MPTRHRVDCVRKTDRGNPHERIHSIGGKNPDGSRWQLDEPTAIAKIKNGTYSFYVERPAGHIAEIIVARSRYGNEYLKTVADGEQPDNLLSLTECPL